MTIHVKIILIYFLLISLAASALTIADKYFAIKQKWRIPETTLMLTGLIGGAVFMLATMKIIRHKTNHKKFMIGLPIEIGLQLFIIAGLMYINH